MAFIPAIQPQHGRLCICYSNNDPALSGRQKAPMCLQDWSQEVVQDSIVFQDEHRNIISNIQPGVDMYEVHMYRRAFAKE